MTPLYPLTFQPLFKRYLWGGRRLGELLGKPIGPENDYAESWEVADHRQGQSTVASGPLAGTTLHELVESRGLELLGRHAPQPRFPLIFKFLDCQRDLSVQVHPDDAAAARLQPPDLGKTEAWVVVAAQPGSRIYAGLKAGCDRAALQRAVEKDEVASCLLSFEPRAGQCVFIPAGTVHALGAGLVVAEIQQASDTTYRLYDWGRVAPGGKPRELHIQQSLDAIDYGAVAVSPRVPQPADRAGCERLVRCDKFILDRLTLDRRTGACETQIGGDERFHIVSVLSGAAKLSGESPSMLIAGQTLLLPACLEPTAFLAEAPTVLLDMYLP